MKLLVKNNYPLMATLFLLTLVQSSTAAAGPSVYQQAISNPQRTQTDLKYDDIRKPALILPFTNIKPADVVLELGAGGGYTTELLSRVVGESGKVFAHRLYKKQRLEANRLPNVVSLRDHSLFELHTVLKENKVKKGELDAIVIFFALHDIYLNSEMDDTVLNTFYSWLKPGGVLIVLDNAAAPDSGLSMTESLHRIGENLIKSDMKKAGFLMDGMTDVLRNKKDNRTKAWGEFKGKQDRFAIRFKKP
jgi:predicted methyltransferase